jgi:hypothetical protein
LKFPPSQQLKTLFLSHKVQDLSEYKKSSTNLAPQIFDPKKKGCTRVQQLDEEEEEEEEGGDDRSTHFPNVQHMQRGQPH